MFSSKSVKSTAMQLLKNKWWTYIAASLIPLSSILANYMVSCILGTCAGGYIMNIVYIALAVFVTAPLFYGTVKFFWEHSNGAESSLTSVFFCFENFGNYVKTFKLNAVIALCFIVTRTVFEIPYTLVNAFSNGEIFNRLGITPPLWTAGLGILSTVFLCIGIAATVLFILRIYPALFISVSNTDIKPFEAISLSLKITKITYFTFVKHLFSYILVIILSVFVLPLIVTLPYIIMCYITHCRYAVALYNKVGKSNN